MSTRGKSKNAGEMRKRYSLTLPATFIVSVICLLVIFQGGFYCGAVCIISGIATIAYMVMAVVRKEQRRCSWVTTLLFAIALLYLISTLAHGMSLTMLQETATWFAVAAISLWCMFPTANDKRHALDALASAGAVLAVLGALMFAGVIPIEGTVNNGRLMFTLQYANASGLFFAVVAVILLSSSSVQRRIASALPIVALLLTQSVGAIGVFVLALAALGIKHVICEKPPHAHVAVAALVSVAVIVAAVALAHDRFAQAMQTFIERIIQILDAGAALARQPLLGLGPDQWQFNYPGIQTAQYKTTQIHCSYLQVAVDAGTIALLVLVALMVLGLWRLARNRDFTSLLIVAMIALHALFDFDLQFAAIAALLALALSEPADAPPLLDTFSQSIAGKALCAAVTCCALLASIGGIFLDVQAGKIQQTSARADADATVELLRSSPYLENDRLMQAYALDALLNAGDFEAAKKLSSGFSQSSPTLSYQQLLALDRLGNDEATAAHAAHMLYDYPYDIELYQAVRDLATNGETNKLLAKAFNNEALRANELASSGHAAWLDNQETVELIGGVEES